MSDKPTLGDQLRALADRVYSLEMQVRSGEISVKHMAEKLGVNYNSLRRFRSNYDIFQVIGKDDAPAPPTDFPTKEDSMSVTWTLEQWRAHGYSVTRERPTAWEKVHTTSFRPALRPACPGCERPMLEVEYLTWDDQRGWWVLQLAYACVRTCPRPHLYATTDTLIF